MALLSLSTSSLFVFASVLFISVAVSVASEPRAFPYFNAEIIQKEGEKCPYTVIVTTSCTSPESTRDHISLAFGDDDGNQVNAPRLDQGETFDKCSSNTFQVKGQCLKPICFAYIYRTGPDGWVPESVEIYAEGEKAVRFDFDKAEAVPDNTWFGHNRCNNTRPQSPPYFPPDTPYTPHDLPPPPPLRPSTASGFQAGEIVVAALLVGVVAIVV